ncbi:Norsolorinic acid reductase [Metarhizium anisopliae BRIP 53293]|uniref:Norsolorinic acid reductase n=1 Tax=Metarhizium anisopliae BRIP 53293 TaxID=1291518 RepID=A0A0D9P2U8_METAN|nr:Norsolorinic acid reductase [Metarhizium anisopliae BRIP 53293]KJK89886.1 Norsolorinic acid reductase [Metarhizium anisopliae BRIP 53284]
MNVALPQNGAPKSPLSRYRLLSPTASVRVSPLCLGSMNFGDAWADWMGECNQESTEKILDFFFEQVRRINETAPDRTPGPDLQGGSLIAFFDLGNFIDTANSYQFEQSETWIGEWMKKRGNRDQMVISTKYTTNFKAGPNHPHIMANYVGNGTKSLHVSVNASLRKLQTDYIDLLYIHWWDYSASIPEVMQSLNQLVATGKILYLGISDAPAWIVSKANEYARNHGLRQFSVYQGRWSASCRDLERDVIPMCKAEGMAITPWGSLGGGNFKTEQARRSSEGRRTEVSDADIKTSRVLEEIAIRKNTAITSIALAYVMHKTPYVFPVIGGRKVEHLKGNIEALTIELTDEEIRLIEAAVPFDLGFPHNFLWGRQVPNPLQDVWLLSTAGNFEHVEEARPIIPKKTGE